MRAGPGRVLQELLTNETMAKQTWDISGTIEVEERQTTGQLQRRPLVGITVDVRGSRLEDAAFVSWGKVATDSQGFFRLRVEKDRARRDFRVRVRFQDRREDEMLAVNTPAVTGALERDWYTVFNTASKVDGPSVNAGTRVFRASTAGDLGVLDNVRRATTWYIVKTVMDFLEGLGTGVEYKKGIKVFYPAKMVTGSSFANGLNRTAYIHKTAKRDQWNVDTIIHEVMHLWNYQHNRGVSSWVAAVCFDFNTHGFQEQPAIAFHEGFAEWAKDELMTNIWGRTKVKPSCRASLAARDLNDVRTVERNDCGVTAGLHLLTTPDIYDLAFGTSTSEPQGATGAGGQCSGNRSAAVLAVPGKGCPPSPAISFADVLSVFLPHPADGWPTKWQVGNDELGLVEFYRRASDILPQFDKATKALYLDLLNAGSTVEPRSRCSA